MIYIFIYLKIRSINIYILFVLMFIAEALADFSKKVMSQSNQADAEKQQNNQQQQKQHHEEEQNQQFSKKNNQKSEQSEHKNIKNQMEKQKQHKLLQQEQQGQQKQNKEEDDDESEEEGIKKRPRTQKQEKQLLEEGSQQQLNNEQKQGENIEENNNTEVQYATILKGQRIVVKETFENGWWFGHPVKKPELQGYFPSNYVKIGGQPPPPQTKIKSKEEKQGNQQQEEVDEDNQEHGSKWIRSQVDGVKTGPIKSDYYQGITGYKMVKVNQNNQSIIQGNHVQFDVNTGLAKVPIKDQAPTAKAVRQMGYYFDYHQWNQQRNTNPNARARPDPKKKKPKKLHLKMMDF